VTSLKKALSSDSYAFVFPKSQVELQKQVNAALKEMQGDGTLKKIDGRWFGKDDSAKNLPDLRLDGKNGVIHLATNSNLAPFAYVKHGKIVGYDIEIAMIIASKLGRTLEIADMDVAAVIPSLMSGKSDMAVGGFTITKERARSVLFSHPNYTGGIVVMVAAGADVRDSAGGKSIWSGLVQSFQRTFVVEDRYKLVLRGLWVTIVISILSAVLGTVLGFVVCMMRRAKTRWANIPARVFIRAIQGTPIVVLLMILYYIVFGSIDINAIAVAIVGFSINFAAYVSEMMRTGIDAVDKGQHEAAFATGFNKLQVFTRITFPQAARHVLPVFKGEFISMLKMTSVVGYIAIQDLTKISDIIRSRTYEAFFPLIATALIYFTIAYVMAFLLSRVEKQIDPKWRKRVVKGVVSP
jgi:polar amino acid transport system substrate-binding protein